jgi:hypothetical protein
MYYLHDNNLASSQADRNYDTLSQDFGEIGRYYDDGRAE